MLFDVDLVLDMELVLVIGCYVGEIVGGSGVMFCGLMLDVRYGLDVGCMLEIYVELRWCDGVCCELVRIFVDSCSFCCGGILDMELGLNMEVFLDVVLVLDLDIL